MPQSARAARRNRFIMNFSMIMVFGTVTAAYVLGTQKNAGTMQLMLGAKIITISFNG